MNTHAAFSSQNVGASIQSGIRMWHPLHWNYTELIPAGAKLACEYSRLSSLSPALGRSAKSLSGVERLWEATVFEQEAKAKQLTTELTEWQEDGVDGHTVHAEKCAGDNVSTNSDDLSRKIKIPLALEKKCAGDNVSTNSDDLSRKIKIPLALGLRQVILIIAKLSKVKQTYNDWSQIVVKIVLSFKPIKASNGWRKMTPKKTPVNTLQNNQVMQLKKSPHSQRRSFYPAPRELFNNYSSSPNGLWVNSPWGRNFGYWLRGHEGERNNCFSKIQPVGQKYREWKNFS